MENQQHPEKQIVRAASRTTVFRVKKIDESFLNDCDPAGSNSSQTMKSPSLTLLLALAGCLFSFGAVMTARADCCGGCGDKASCPSPTPAPSPTPSK
jgi:hypothetical protein